MFFFSPITLLYRRQFQNHWMFLVPICHKKADPLHGSQSFHVEGTCITQWGRGALMRGATQGGQVTVKSSDKTWSSSGGHGKPLRYSCCENPWTVWKESSLTNSVVDILLFIGSPLILDVRTSEVVAWISCHFEEVWLYYPDSNCGIWAWLWFLPSWF